MNKNIRQLAAIMFTDMVGYTALMQKNEKIAIEKRERHRKVLRQFIEEHYGLILQYYGDGTLSIFGSVVDAVNCAVKIQLELNKEPKVPLRIGMHVGDIVYSDDGVYGDAVNIASRIENLSVPGGVLISDKAFDEIKNHPEFPVKSIGTFNLKNVKNSVELFALANDGLQIPDMKQSEVPGEQETASENNNDTYPLLETKLFLPQPRQDLVQREQLLNLLSDGIKKKLILISAPAGFGKTTLISDWLHQNKLPAAWISLDQSDNDLQQFLSYMIAALKNIDPKIGQRSSAMLQSPQMPPVENIIAALIKEINDFPHDFVLVLDDYHIIDSPKVHNVIELLLERMPSQMHLAMTTRVDPPLPVARLRVRNQLSELRAADLCFSQDETAYFFNKLMKLELSSQDIFVLESRTEGWIAGLQLAALSLQGRKDSGEFIKSFAGDDRHIVDYLVEEVLNIQPEHIQIFLLQTSILDRLSAPLCDFIREKTDSQLILDDLEKSNLFTIALDNKRQWYRYHQLFADLLKNRLQHSSRFAADINKLNKRASMWYEQKGYLIKSFQHAFAAKDIEHAARLLELAWPEMDARFNTHNWLNFAKKLPEEIFINRPVLNMDYAWALLNEGNIEAGEARLNQVEKWLAKRKDSGNLSQPENGSHIFADEKQLRYLPATAATARAYLTQANGDIGGSIKYAQQALDLVPEEDHLQRGPAAALLAISKWADGKLEDAIPIFNEAIVNFKKAGNIYFAMSVTLALADIRMTQGRLNDANHACEQALLLENEQHEPVLVAADIYLLISLIHIEQGDLKEADKNLTKSKKLAEQGSLADWSYRFCLAQSRFKELQGDLAGALNALDEAERVYFRTPLPIIRPVSALKARIWLKQGKVREAISWSQNQNLSVNDDLSFLQEFEHITLFRILFKVSKKGSDEPVSKEAMTFLSHLLKAAENGGRMSSVIEILVLQSIFEQSCLNTERSIEKLRRALSLAEPENHIRIFIDEGDRLNHLLEKVLEEKNTRLAAFVKKIIVIKGKLKVDLQDNNSDHLSQRELQVLQFIEAGFSNKKIMDELFLSLSTVKTHIRNIFSKLDVHSRTEAVAKAKNLNLL